MIETKSNKQGGKIKGIFGKVFAPIKRFISNLKIILKVQKGALIKFLATILLPVLVGILGYGVIASPSVEVLKILAWVFIAIFVVFTLSILLWARHDYKVAIKEAAKVEEAKAKKSAYKKRKASERKSIESQNKQVEANKINAKYNK